MVIPTDKILGGEVQNCQMHRLHLPLQHNICVTICIYGCGQVEAVVMMLLRPSRAAVLDPYMANMSCRVFLTMAMVMAPANSGVPIVGNARKMMMQRCSSHSSLDWMVGESD